jgi:hypothetical protein
MEILGWVVAAVLLLLLGGAVWMLHVFASSIGPPMR